MLSSQFWSTTRSIKITPVKFLVYANYLIVLGFWSFGFEILNFFSNSDLLAVVEMPAGDRPEQANKYVKRSPPRLPGFWGGILYSRCCWDEVKRAIGAGILLAAQKLIDDGGRCFGREGFLKFP